MSAKFSICSTPSGKRPTHFSFTIVDASSETATEEIRAGRIAAEVLAQMAEGKSESEAADAVKIPYTIVEEIVREQVLPLYNATSLEEAIFKRWRLGVAAESDS